MAVAIFCIMFSANGFSQNIGSTEIKKDTVSGKDRQTITIQVISQKNRGYAEEELKRLKSHGLDAIVSYESVKDKGMFYRVYVGQFENRKAALAFANGLVDKGIISGFWIKKASVFEEIVQHPEAPQADTQKPTLEVPPPKEKIETVPKKTPIPQKPLAAPEVAIPPEIPEPEAADAIAPADVLPEAVEQEGVAPPEIPKPKAEDTLAPVEVLPEAVVEQEKAPAIPISAVEKDQEKGRLSFGLKSSLLFSSKADDFKITKTSTDSINSWIFEDNHKYGGLVASFQLNDRFAIESGIERGLFTKLELWQLSVGTSYHFQPIGLLTPFLRGGLVVGDLKWDDAPGDFDTGLGWEGGIGVYLIKSKIKLGVEASYRQMKYTYNKPSGQEVTATDDSLDMTGFALSGTLSYLF